MEAPTPTPTPATDLAPITSFREEFGFLSNFSHSLFSIDLDALSMVRNETILLDWPAPKSGGTMYGSVENAFQAAKTDHKPLKERIRTVSPSDAKRMGRVLVLRPDWEQVKIGVMRALIKAKFDQNPDLRRLLLATGVRPLIEGNHWKDRFWGMVPVRSVISGWIGENWLGRLLMEVRDSYPDNDESELVTHY